MNKSSFINHKRSIHTQLLIVNEYIFKKSKLYRKDKQVTLKPFDPLLLNVQ